MKQQLTILFLLAVSGLLSAQSPGTQSRQQEINTIMERYLGEAQSHAQIYTGREPVPYASHIKNHPYLQAGVFNGGLLAYDGVQYPRVNLLLDLYREQLLILTPENAYVILQSERVNFADLYNRRIIYHYPDSLKGCPPQGYYLLLHDGNCRVLEKQSCSLVETRKDKEIEGTFHRSSRFYILKDGIYHTVKSKGSVLNVFKAHKKELNLYSRQQHLNFRRETGNAIVEIVKQYETLNKQP